MENAENGLLCVKTLLSSCLIFVGIYVNMALIFVNVSEQKCKSFLFIAYIFLPNLTELYEYRRKNRRNSMLHLKY